MQALIYNIHSEFLECIKKHLKQYSIQSILLEEDRLSSLIKLKDTLEEQFFLIDATNFFDFDPQIMLDFIEDKPALLALYFNQNSGIYPKLSSDFLVLAGDNQEISFDGYASANICLLKKDLLDKAKTNFSFTDFFDELSEHSKLYALALGGFYISKPNPKNIKLIHQRLEENPKTALFLDRDNLLIEDSGYTFGTNIKCLNLADDYIAKFNAENNPVIVVSNQSGVARGFFGLAEVELTNQAVAQAYLAKGLRLDDFFYCPYHNVGSVSQYVQNSKLRKPEVGMIFLASQKYRLDLRKSLMFGDNPQTDLLNLPYIKSQILK